MTVIGIINDAVSPIVIDEYQAMIDAADQHGLKIIIVGAGQDMGCELMRKIIESERFEVRQQIAACLRPERNSQYGGGPRDKWGRLK